MQAQDATVMTANGALQELSFKVLQRPVRVKMVPNEDGLGPSTALLYVARGLQTVASGKGIRLEFVVQNQTKAEFNAEQYGGLGHSVVGVDTEPLHSVIELVKDGERVVPLDTAERLLDYPWKAKAYERFDALTFGPNKAESALDAVICMGTPVAHRAACERGVPVIEVFDHCWPISLERIMEDDKKIHPDDWRTRKIKDVMVADERFAEKRWEEEWRGRLVRDVLATDIIPAITRDDKLLDKKVHHVFMFPEPLAPGEFLCKWQSLAPGRVSTIGGVLGGWEDKERESVRAEARGQLTDKLKWKASNVENARIILVQGGGTPTWDRFLIQMVGQCIDWSGRLGDTLFLFPGRAVELALKSKYSDRATARERGWEQFEQLEESVRESGNARLITGTAGKDFADFQKFYLVSDLVFSRPGGITVQDAIACRTPIVCAAEPGHWQTEKIRQHCELYGILRPVKFEAFEAGGIGLVIDQYGRRQDNSRMVEVMRTIANRQEYKLAEEILGMVAQGIAERSKGTGQTSTERG